MPVSKTRVRNKSIFPGSKKIIMKKYRQLFSVLFLTISLTILANHLHAQNNWILFSGSGKYGFKDNKGNIMIAAKYDSCNRFDEGLASVKLNSKWGFIDKTGKEVIPIKYDFVTRFNNGSSNVQLNNKWGFIDKAGKEIVPVKYQKTGNFIEYGLVLIQQNDKWGYADDSGKEIIPPKYYAIEIAMFELEDEPSDWFKVKINANDEWKLIDRKGRYLAFDDYDIGGYVEDMLAVASKHKWGFADYNGTVVIPMKFQNAYTFRKGRVAVRLNNKWGFIDKTGKEVIPIKYDSIKLLNHGSEDYYKFKTNNKFGLLDTMGKEVIHAKYEDINPFTEGLAAFKLNGKWGYVDKTGKEIIPAQYDLAYTFTGGKANVTKDGKTFRIDSPLQDKTTNQKTETASRGLPVKLVKPPMPLKGKIDPTLTGVWKYTDASGRITYMKMNADGTSESYLNSVTPANKSKGFCYWLIDGSFYESICDGGTSVNRYTFQKGYDKATGKPTLNLAGYIYIAADNKTSW